MSPGLQTQAISGKIGPNSSSRTSRMLPFTMFARTVLLQAASLTSMHCSHPCHCLQAIVPLILCMAVKLILQHKWSINLPLYDMFLHQETRTERTSWACLGAVLPVTEPYMPFVGLTCSFTWEFSVAVMVLATLCSAGRSYSCCTRPTLHRTPLAC